MSSSKEKHDQCKADASLFLNYEASKQDSQGFFNYTEAVGSSSSSGNTSNEEINRFLKEFPRGNHTQSFGCLICFQPPSFEIVAHSENTLSITGLQQYMQAISRQDLLGLDVRTIFTFPSSITLTRAISPGRIDPNSNPLLLAIRPEMVMQHDKNRKYFAILHWIEMGVVIDLEPTYNVPERFHVSGAYESERLGANEVSRLLSFSHESINGLCDGFVRTMREFIPYDRVMIYKFDDDGHGEVVSELTKPGLEPYLGLHFPATDIPLIARHLFALNRVRIIVDASAPAARIIQSEKLHEPLILAHSTLRAPHPCHAEYMSNMGSKGTLVLPIGVNDNDRMKLWGLVACHHSGPFYVPFPIRQACVFLMKTFETQLRLKLQLVDLLRKEDEEQKLFKSKVLLTNMDFPFVLNKSPNLKDIIDCDGAAIFSGDVCQVSGVTPTAEQIKDIVRWLLSSIKNSMWYTDSLVNAGYPNASMLGEVCGMAIIRNPPGDVVLLWFRCEAKREVKWGRDPQHLTDEVGMNPRTSFQAFCEVIKNKSLQWNIWEIRAMQFARHIIILKDISLATSAMMQEFEKSPIPIFVVNQTGIITNWNFKMVGLTGLYPREVVGKSSITELVTEEYREIFRDYLSRALRGEAGSTIRLRVKAADLNNQGDESVLIVVNSYLLKNHKNEVINVYMLGQDLNTVENVTSELLKLEEVICGHYRWLESECKRLHESGPSGGE